MPSTSKSTKATRGTPVKWPASQSRSHTHVTSGVLKVGITIAPADNAHGILYQNGMHQNVIYMALLLRNIPNVEVSFVPYPFGNPLHPVGVAFDIPTISERSVALGLDVIIELGTRLEHEFTLPFRLRGGKLVSYMAGNAMVMNMESLFAKEETRGDSANPHGFDACWVTPQHWHTNRDYCILTRSPVTRQAPHIWSEVCLQRSCKLLDLEPPGFVRPEDNKWKLGCFDANVNVVKTFHFPLLAAEAAFRGGAPIDKVMLFCTEHLKDRPHVNGFVLNTKLGGSRVFCEGRHLIGAVLGKFVDCVVSHTWENDLNYAFWDALFLGYPLVHTSPFIKDAGYYYPVFEPIKGAVAIADALENHQGGREQDTEAVWAHHVNNPKNIAAHAELLLEVLDTPAFEG